MVVMNRDNHRPFQSQSQTLSRTQSYKRYFQLQFKLRWNLTNQRGLKWSHDLFKLYRLVKFQRSFNWRQKNVYRIGSWLQNWTENVWGQRAQEKNFRRKFVEQPEVHLSSSTLFGLKLKLSMEASPTSNYQGCLENKEMENKLRSTWTSVIDLTAKIKILLFALSRTINNNPA